MQSNENDTSVSCYTFSTRIHVWHQNNFRYVIKNILKQNDDEDGPHCLHPSKLAGRELWEYFFFFYWLIEENGAYCHLKADRIMHVPHVQH